MSTVIGVSLNGQRVPLSRERIAAIARSVLGSRRASNVMLSIAFVDNRAIRTMNRSHLRRDRITDVIAFAFRGPDRRAPIVGDVYIAPAVARASAKANGITVGEELTRLVVHGTLHVLGDDHPEDGRRTQSAMWNTQERLVQRIMAKKR